MEVSKTRRLRIWFNCLASRAQPHEDQSVGHVSDLTHEIKPRVPVFTRRFSEIRPKISLFLRVIRDNSTPCYNPFIRNRREFTVRHTLAAISFLVATVIMYVGVGTSFLPSTSRAEANEVWTYFFSAWVLSLAMVFLTRVLMVRARRGIGLRNPNGGRWTDLVVTAQAAICVGYLLWGISARLEGR